MASLSGFKEVGPLPAAAPLSFVLVPLSNITGFVKCHPSVPIRHPLSPENCSTSSNSNRNYSFWTNAKRYKKRPSNSIQINTIQIATRKPNRIKPQIAGYPTHHPDPANESKLFRIDKLRGQQA